MINFLKTGNGLALVAVGDFGALHVNQAQTLIEEMHLITTSAPIAPNSCYR